LVSGATGLIATLILSPRLEINNNLARLQQEKLRRMVKT
jgi:hypothetical protein